MDSTKMLPENLPVDERPQRILLTVEFTNPQLPIDELQRRIKEEFGADDVYVTRERDLLTELAERLRAKGIHAKQTRTSYRTVSLEIGPWPCYAFIQGIKNKQHICIQSGWWWTPPGVPKFYYKVRSINDAVLAIEQEIRKYENSLHNSQGDAGEVCNGNIRQVCEDTNTTSATGNIDRSNRDNIEDG